MLFKSDWVVGNLQLNTSEHGFEDIQEMSELRNYLMKLAIKPRFNWNGYTLMARVEDLSFFNLEYSESDIFESNKNLT